MFILILYKFYMNNLYFSAKAFILLYMEFDLYCSCYNYLGDQTLSLEYNKKTLAPLIKLI